MSDTDINLTSYLPASGFTHTHSKLHAWVEMVVLEVKRELGEEKLIAGIASFREQGRQHLSCDLWLAENKNKFFPITICAEGEHYFPDECKGGVAEADTYDMAEAIHLAGIIVSSLKASILLGRQSNEINPDVLCTPLVEGQTNGKIKLF